jgi:hypothetical protein
MKRPTTPAHLGSEGALFWREMIGDHDITTTGRMAVLTRAAECVDRLAAAQADIAKNGLIVITAAGPRANPATKLEREARDGFLRAMHALQIGADERSAQRGPGRPGLPIGWAGREIDRYGNPTS